jgi:hypothetical protein
LIFTKAPQTNHKKPGKKTEITQIESCTGNNLAIDGTIFFLDFHKSPTNKS